MSYFKEVVDLAAAIRASAERIQVLEKARRDWDRTSTTRYQVKSIKSKVVFAPRTVEQGEQP